MGYIIPSPPLFCGQCRKHPAVFKFTARTTDGGESALSTYSCGSDQAAAKSALAERVAALSWGSKTKWGDIARENIP